MKRLFLYLSSPIVRHFATFVLFFILSATFDLYFFLRNCYYQSAVYVLFHNFLLSYLVAFVAEVLPKRIRKIYINSLLLLAVILFAFDLFCISVYEIKLTQQFIAIIYQTNFTELCEFIESYLSYSYVFYLLLLLIGLWYVYKILDKRKISSLLSSSILVFVLGGLALTCRNPMIYKDTFIGKIAMFFQTSSIPNLEDYIVKPKIVSMGEKPENIVMIIGESFSKSHSSLYGYEKKTNPLLGKRSSDELLVYKNIKAPATNTIPCIQSIMSTYKMEYKDSVLWYQCMTLPGILHSLGYNTTWVSNQSKVGIFDTVAGEYADLCNNVIFVGDKYAGLMRNSLDEEVIPMLKTCTENKNPYNFYFVHLMGSHSTFKSRYPISFDRFKTTDYLYRPEHQREKLSTYDNSILYNDSVVNEIINLFKDKEALVFYFSDHAIDAYESSDNYMAHAKENIPLSVEAGKNIPFMIYTSSKYRQNFENKFKIMKASIDCEFCTEDIICSVLDLLDVDLEGVDEKEYSLFKQ